MIDLAVHCDNLDLIKGTTIAKEDTESSRPLPDQITRRLLKSRGEGIPTSWLRRLAPSLQPVIHALEESSLFVLLTLRDNTQQSFHGTGLPIDPTGDTSRNPSEKISPLGGFRDLDQRGRIRFGKRTHPIPDHLGEIVIVGIFAASCESKPQRSTLFEGEPLKSRRKGETNQSRFVPLSSCEEGFENFSRQGLRHAFLHRSKNGIKWLFVDEETDRPSPDAFFPVLQQSLPFRNLPSSHRRSPERSQTRRSLLFHGERHRMKTRA